MDHLSWDGNSTHLYIGSWMAKLLVLICSTRSAMMAHLILVCSLFSFDTTENHWKQQINFEVMMFSLVMCRSHAADKYMLIDECSIIVARLGEPQKVARCLRW